MLSPSLKSTTLSINGNLCGSEIAAAISAGKRKGGSLKLSKRSIKPSEPQPSTRLFPPAKASSTNISTPVATSRVSIPAAAKTASIDPRVAIPTSLQPVQPIATARQSPLAVNLAISASRTLFAAA